MNPETRTYNTTWLGQPAVVLETTALRFVIVPGMGAKIVSLFDKHTGRQWLLPPINRSFEPVAYSASFVDQDMSGWDEMFPTIDACQYPVEGKYKDTMLPDHGEVWALPWHIESMTNDAIRLFVEGRALRYRLTRTLRVLAESRVRLEFEVINIGIEPLIALWAAHPQFQVDKDTRIRLPASVDRVVNVHASQDWGEVNRSYPWSEAESQNGQIIRLERIGSADLHKCRKFYLPHDYRVTWAALQQRDNGEWIRLSWDSEHVPYLGIWVDEGTYNAAPTAALEPATGFYDKLDVAWQNNRVMHLPPNEPVHWYLDIEIGSGALKEPDR
jgi:galactose mutarotase-like enzyme